MRVLFKNASITLQSGKAEAGSQNCLLVANDIIEHIGSENDEKIAKLKEQSDLTVKDLHGHSILPSFVDGHMHMLLYASSLVKVPLENCHNLEEIRAAIKEAAMANPDLPRIFCKGWRQTSTNGAALASMIDDIDPRPIFIDAEDQHSSWCNTAALKELGVEDMPDPVGGQIHRDDHGRPTGLISEQAAFTIVWPHFGNIMPLDYKLDCIRRAIRDYSAAGYTGVVEMAMDAAIWETLKILRSKETIPLRIAAHWFINPSRTDEENLAQVDKAIQEHTEYNIKTSPNFRIAGIKIICDGVVDACTATLSQPYNTGELPNPLWQASALQKVVEKADATGLQCALHAIGDAAVTLAVDTLSSLKTTGRRHRIEHLELTRPEDARRLGAAGITASIQPVHCDPTLLRDWPRLIGSDRTSRAFAYREFLDHGAQLAIGTDAPTAPHLPFPNVYQATTRNSARDRSGKVKPVNEHFKLDLKDAMSAATWGAAYSCFAEGFTGSLEVGKKADFVVVDTGRDWGGDLERLLEVRVVETWFEGERVFAADDA